MSDTIVWRDGLSEQGGYNRYGDSPYYTAPKGTEILVEHDWAGDYEFDMVVVWRDTTTGELRGAWDAGCSCPDPFADLTWDTMRPIREVDDLKPLVDATDEADWDGTDPGVADLKAAVHRALRDAA